jgi:nitroimidazol reductase NimA-like FMN-containing flavoprotein (pyridoxamine 5'-phosphate oxidase superfamily)/GNAT superfamily N-acetyltransferase
MRKEMYRMDRAEAVRFLAGSPYMHIATIGSDGMPILRTVHTVWDGEALYFHGAQAGEKMEALGKPCVLSFEEVVTNIPSYFVDPERACPATTYYRSVQVHGTLERVDDDREKETALGALMRKHQPEGGYRRLAVTDEMYTKAIRSLLVVRVRPTRTDGKCKMGQNRTPEERARILERLWQRGDPGDPRAIEALLRENPKTPLPAFLRAELPRGEVGEPAARMHVALDPYEPERDAIEIAALLDGAYWLEGLPRDVIARAFLTSSAVVFARTGDGAIIGAARASGDARYQTLLDVFVAPSLRGKGLGQALVRVILDHPVVRGAFMVRLKTRDAQSLYERFGFRDVTKNPVVPWRVSEMEFRRSAAT